MTDAKKLEMLVRLLPYVQEGDETLDLPDLVAALLERVNADWTERGL